MRYLLILPLLLVPVAGLAQTAADQLTKAVQESQCTRPDRSLIKVETGGRTSWTSESAPSVKYNRQTKGFNDCARVYVEKANVEIARIRDATKAETQAMAAAATTPASAGSSGRSMTRSNGSRRSKAWPVSRPAAPTLRRMPFPRRNAGRRMKIF